MAVTRDQLATGVAVASVSSVVVTWPVLPAAGSKALVEVSLGDGATVSVTGAVDNGTTPTTYTADSATAASSAHSGKYILRADGITLPATGSYHVTVTLSTTVNWATASGCTYTGLATGGPTSAPAPATGTSASVATPNVTPAVTGALVFGGFSDNSGSTETITLTTSGANSIFTETNGVTLLCGAVADHIVTTTSAQGLAWTLTPDTPGWSAVVAVYSPAATAVPGTGALSGSGTFGGTELTTAPGAGAFTGSGTLGAAAAVTAVGSGAFTGTGTFGAAGAVFVPGQGAGALTGSGTLGGTVTLTVAGTGAFTGSGTLGGTVTGLTLQSAQMDGNGTLGLSGFRLGVTLALTGTGLMFVPQVLGGLVTGVGGAVMPQALPGSSQVAVAPPGSSNWQWIGTLGQVTALTYSYVCPGGCDKMTMTVMVPAAYRTQLFNPGWKVKITRGGHQVWDGKLDEPVPTSAGWNLTAVGTGNLGANFLATYTSTWPASQPDQIINNAISRGLPWSNPGLNSSPYASQFWFGQQVDSAAQTITAFLSLICTRGGLTWYVNSQPGGAYTGDDLTIFPLPTVPSRLLVCTTPVARTLGGDVNTIFIRYMSAADNSTTGTVATYGTVTAVNAASVAAHGVIETYIDLSDVGQMTSAAAAGVGNSALLAFQRASFAGPFSAGYGDLLNIGGQPIDPGTDQSGTVCRLILSDYAYGGEVTPEFPVSFLVGGYEWDDFGQVATISPFQSVDQSLTGLLSMTNTVLTPIAVASG